MYQKTFRIHFGRKKNANQLCQIDVKAFHSASGFWQIFFFKKKEKKTHISFIILH